MSDEIQQFQLINNSAHDFQRPIIGLSFYGVVGLVRWRWRESLLNLSDQEDWQRYIIVQQVSNNFILNETWCLWVYCKH